MAACAVKGSVSLEHGISPSNPTKWRGLYLLAYRLIDIQSQAELAFLREKNNQ